jgi:hypothetical protein
MPYIGAGIQKFNTADGLTVNGDAEVTGTVNPSGDTASGDVAAVGFTSAEGLILTGQGSTSDVVIKNDADTTVCFVPTGTDDLKFNDTARIIMGAGDDMQIIHDGSNSIISDNGTGNLVLRSDAAAVEIDFNTDETAALFNHNGSVELYHDNSKKIETTSNGVTVTNSIQFGSDAQTKVAGAGSSDVDLLVSGDTNIRFETGTNERMRIDSSGHLLIGKTDTGTDDEGAVFGPGDLQSFTRNGQKVLRVRRNTSDGTIVEFHQDGNQEGTISVSGSTVSYNGGHLSRWSQATDGNRIDGLVKGTVMTNLDQMAEWTKDGVTENNEQLNCMAVSSAVGDANVAGVFVNWDDDDEDYTADMNIAMTGDMVIRIAKDTTVARGDLLMSAGDGTAKPQDDDIVRSKTIAKVTSITKSHTYDDGSYLVPCVLMAC